jgi:hypothetical protein
LEEYMSADTQFEREENDIWERAARGEITNAQARKEQRELQRDYAAAAVEAAQGAYERELERWQGNT